ncbi:MAG: response regulator [Candidatus Alcyoniella australis]|nr:response regulator [Candidatus Alcyoniella australis]
MERIRIIVGDSEVSLAGMLMDALKGRVEKVVATPVSDELLKSLESGGFDIAVVDLGMNGYKGGELIKKVFNVQPNIAVIAMINEQDLGGSLEMLKDHSCQMLVRPFMNEELMVAAERALEVRQLKLAKLKLSEQLELRGPDTVMANMPDKVPVDSQQLKRAKKVLRESAVVPIEKAFVVDALQRNEYNVTKAAKQVGMQRPNFQAMMRKHGLKLSLMRRRSD